MELCVWYHGEVRRESGGAGRPQYSELLQTEKGPRFVTRALGERRPTPPTRSTVQAPRAMRDHRHPRPRSRNRTRPNSLRRLARAPGRHPTSHAIERTAPASQEHLQLEWVLATQHRGASSDVMGGLRAHASCPWVEGLPSPVLLLTAVGFDPPVHRSQSALSRRTARHKPSLFPA